MSSLRDWCFARLHLVQRYTIWRERIGRNPLNLPPSSPYGGHRRESGNLSPQQGAMGAEYSTPPLAREKAEFSRSDRRARVESTERENREPIRDSYFERDAWRGIQQRRRAEALRAHRQNSSSSLASEWSERHAEGFGVKIIAWLLREPSPSPRVADSSSTTQNESRFLEKAEKERTTSSVEAPHGKRVPGFLSVCCDNSEEAELGDFPIFETESPLGNARVSPTHRQMRWKLGHIAKAARESRLPLFRLDLGVVEFSFTRQTNRSPSQSNVVEAIEELEEFVASQLEGEKEARYQKALRSRRW